MVVAVERGLKKESMYGLIPPGQKKWPFVESTVDRGSH